MTELNATLIVDDVPDQASFLKLARQLGRPVQLENGSFTRTLCPTESSVAPKNSLSSRFGKGMFPFHTDTAFWSPPARLILLRGVRGDLRRPTYVRDFGELLGGLPTQTVRRSSWICDIGTRKFYTLLAFENITGYGFRYDLNCMRPADSNAKEIDALLRRRCTQLEGEKVEWREGRVIVINNWTHLHARGIAPMNEGERVLERIYLR